MRKIDKFIEELEQDRLMEEAEERRRFEEENRQDEEDGDDEDDYSAERSTSYSFDAREADILSETQSTEDIDRSSLGGGPEMKPDDELEPTRFGLKACRPKNIYCNNSELIEEIKKYQDTGIATEKLGDLIIKIALHMTTMARFWRYPHSLKEELAQNAIYRMLCALPKFDRNNPKGNAFGYLSMISYRDMLHTLKVHFKQNKVHDAVADAYLTRLPSDSANERIGLLRQTLQRSEEFNAFCRSRTKKERTVDLWALSRPQQEEYHRRNRLREENRGREIGESDK